MSLAGRLRRLPAAIRRHLGGGRRRLLRAASSGTQKLRIWRRRLRWAIVTTAPAGDAGDHWGDVAFAEDLAAALRKRGQVVHIDRWQSRIRPRAKYRDDVTIALRGLQAVAPVPGSRTYLWVISHPELVQDYELTWDYVGIFAASEGWAQRTSESSGRRVKVLLQAAGERFHPGPAGELRSDVLFVGTTREVVRPVVRDVAAVGADLSIYGHGWQGIVPDSMIRAERLDNGRLPEAYRGARIVLNDHWDDMREEGFMSNRLFEAAAVGVRVISDRIDGADELFGGLVRSYRSLEELRALLDDRAQWADDETLAAASQRIRDLHSFDARAAWLVERAYVDIRQA